MAPYSPINTLILFWFLVYSKDQVGKSLTPRANLRQIIFLFYGRVDILANRYQLVPHKNYMFFFVIFSCGLHLKSWEAGETRPQIKKPPPIKLPGLLLLFILICGLFIIILLCANSFILSSFFINPFPESSQDIFSSSEDCSMVYTAGFCIISIPYLGI